MKLEDFWNHNYYICQIRANVIKLMKDERWIKYNGYIDVFFFVFYVLSIISGFHSGFWIFLLSSIYELLSGIHGLLFKTHITFLDFWCDRNLHYAFIMHSVFKYRVYCLTLRIFYAQYYLGKIFKKFSSQTDSENQNINLKTFLEWYNNAAFKRTVLELAPIIELFLYKFFITTKAKYALLFYQYIIAIVPFAYHFNNNHKEFWNWVYSYLTTGSTDTETYNKISNSLQKFAVMIVTFGSKQKTD